MVAGWSDKEREEGNCGQPRKAMQNTVRRCVINATTEIVVKRRSKLTYSGGRVSLKSSFWVSRHSDSQPVEEGNCWLLWWRQCKIMWSRLKLLKIRPNRQGMYCVPITLKASLFSYAWLVVVRSDNRYSNQMTTTCMWFRPGRPGRLRSEKSGQTFWWGARPLPTMVRMSGAMTLFFLQYLGDLTFVYHTVHR